MTNISDLSALVSNASLATAQKIAAAEHNAVRTIYDNRANALLNIVTDLEKNYSSASAPNDTPDGKLWYDSSGLLVKLRRSSAWETLVGLTLAQTLTNKTLTGIGVGTTFATGGSDTYKASGVLLRNTAENARTTTGVLRAFTVAAGDWDTNGQVIRLTAYIEKSGASGTCTIQVRFGTTPTSRIAFSFTADTTGAYYIEAILTRISATAVDVAGYALSELEADSVAAFNAGSADIDLTAAQTLDLNLSAISAGTVTWQGGIVEFLA